MRFWTWGSWVLQNDSRTTLQNDAKGDSSSNKNTRKQRRRNDQLVAEEKTQTTTGSGEGHGRVRALCRWRRAGAGPVHALGQVPDMVNLLAPSTKSCLKLNHSGKGSPRPTRMVAPWRWHRCGPAGPVRHHIQILQTLPR